MKRKSLGLVLACVCYTTAYAAPALPGSDSELRAMEQNREQNVRQTVIEATGSVAKVQGEDQFTLQRVTFTGQEIIDTAIFAELIQTYIGQTVTLSDLQNAADKITAYCRQQGYAVAAAFLPPQDVKDGNVEIRVLLGQLGQIKLDNQSRLSEGRAEAFTSALRRGTYLTINKAETVLNNLNDLPGVAAVGMLSAGQETGETDLTVTLQNEDALETLLYADNYGGRYSGRYRYGFQTTFNNPGHIGDRAFLGGLLTNDHTHNYNLGYEMPLGSRGSRLGISYSQMDYTLGDYFNLLEAVGTARTFSFYGSTPLVNSRGSYVAASYGYDHRQLKDEYRLFGYSNAKTSNAMHMGILGRSVGRNSYTGYSALYYWGVLTNDDYAGANEGGFQKLNTDINHIQRLGQQFNLHLNFHSQLASKELDSSEQFYLGGANGVRAYPQGEAGGDSGYQATAELRFITPLPQLTLAAFVDWGEIMQRGNVADQHRDLAGWGLGLQYSQPGNYYMRLDYARKINGEAYQSEAEDKNSRLWFQAVKMF